DSSDDYAHDNCNPHKSEPHPRLKPPVGNHCFVHTRHSTARPIRPARATVAFRPGALDTNRRSRSPFQKGQVMRRSLKLRGGIVSGIILSGLLVAVAIAAENFKYKAIPSGQFDGMQLTEAKFDYSVISDAHFERATLPRASFKYTVASDAWFSKADLQNADLRYSVLTDAKFGGADCRGAKFRYS